MESVPIVVGGQVRKFAILQENAARDIIESFMIAANVAMARFLRDAQFPLPAAGRAHAQTLGPHPRKSPRNWVSSCRRSRTRARWARFWSNAARPTRFISPNCRWPC